MSARSQQIGDETTSAKPTSCLGPTGLFWLRVPRSAGLAAFEMRVRPLVPCGQPSRLRRPKCRLLLAPWETPYGRPSVEVLRYSRSPGSLERECLLPRPSAGIDFWNKPPENFQPHPRNAR